MTLMPFLIAARTVASSISTPQPCARRASRWRCFEQRAVAAAEVEGRGRPARSSGDEVEVGAAQGVVIA